MSKDAKKVLIISAGVMMAMSCGFVGFLSLIFINDTPQGRNNMIEAFRDVRDPNRKESTGNQAEKSQVDNKIHTVDFVPHLA